MDNARRKTATWWLLAVVVVACVDMGRAVGPSIAHMRPQPGSIDVATDATVVLTFSEPMDTMSMCGAMHVVQFPYQGGTRVDVGGSCAAINATTLVFVPRNDLPEGSTVNVTVTREATSAGGERMARAFSGAFTTVTKDADGPAAGVSTWFLVALIGTVCALCVVVCAGIWWFILQKPDADGSPGLLSVDQVAAAADALARSPYGATASSSRHPSAGGGGIDRAASHFDQL